MARDTPIKKYDIKFNEECLDWYSASEYPRFSICVNYGSEEIGDYDDTEYLEYFSPNSTEDLIDYINTDLQEKLNEFDDIESVEIVWEINCEDLELVDTIYSRK